MRVPHDPGSVETPVPVLLPSDQPSAATIIDNIYKATSALAWKLSRGTNLYEDLRQEGLLAAFQTINSFSPGRGAKLTTFVLACARNRMLDYLRHERRAQACLISGDAQFSDDTSQTLFDTISERATFASTANNKVLTQQLHHCLERLPEKERYCVKEFFFRDVTQSSVAESLSVTRTRVSHILQKALGRLRKNMLQ